MTKFSRRMLAKMSSIKRKVMDFEYWHLRASTSLDISFMHFAV